LVKNGLLIYCCFITKGKTPMTEDKVLGFLRWCRCRGLLLVAAGANAAPTTSACTSHAADADDHDAAYSANQGGFKLGTGALTFTRASSTRAAFYQALSATDVVRCICSYL
jgi:hypothetical protein